MKKTVLFIATVLVVVGAFAGVALAASPQDIYNDWVADGTLDGTYTDAELQAYLADATLDQYGDPAILTALDAVVRGLIQEDRGEFPFTGVQMGLMALAVAVLLSGGLGLRRLGRSRQ